jgi:hypothetical protein
MFGVNDASLPADAIEVAAACLADVASDFGEEIGGPPTLAEFLEVLGWAVPVNSEATDGSFPQPLTFKAKLKGNKRYGSDRPSRVCGLNDGVFVDATDCLVALAEQLSAADGTLVSPQRFAAALFQVLQSGKIALADVTGEDVSRLTAEPSKQRGAKPGDVLAIPAHPGGYRMAVVVTRNRFGTALGLFQGRSPQGRLSPGLREAPRKYPVYTEESQVKNGTWRIVGHDESLLALFPADPPIYHRPNAWPGIVDTGTYGGAETADGSMRFIDADEAREVGIQDGTYHSSRSAAFLQKALDDEEDHPSQA